MYETLPQVLDTVFFTQWTHSRLCTAALKERTSCVLAGGQSSAQSGSKVSVLQCGCKQFVFSPVDFQNELALLLQVRTKFILALCFSFLFMFVEVIGGYFANRCAVNACETNLFAK